MEVDWNYPSGMNVYVGLDVGGTKLMVGAGTGRGEVLRVVKRPTPAALADGLKVLDDMVGEVLATDCPVGIGVAIGGPLDWRTGVVSPLHQPAWRDVPLKQQLETRWNCPVNVDVDTNVAAVGEYFIGGYHATRFLYLTLSTGMGGGFLVNGELYRGGFGEAHPEVGHQLIPFRCSYPERAVCECGGGACLEALVSGNGIRQIYGRPAEELSEEHWSEVAFNLGMGLRNLATIYAPDIIVIGGGITHARGEKLLSPAREAMRARLKLVPVPEVRASILGYDTALRGAVVFGTRR